MAVVFLAVMAGPAYAGGVHEGDPVSVAFPDIDVPVGGDAVDPLGPNLWSTTGPLTLTGATVAYAISGITGVRLSPSPDHGGDCVMPSPARVVCSDPRELSFEGETVEQYLPVVVSAAGTARRGDTGTVTITVSADGLAPITGHSVVRVVAGRAGLPITGSMAGLLGALLLAAGAAAVLLTGRSPSGR